MRQLRKKAMDMNPLERLTDGKRVWREIDKKGNSQ